MRPVIPMAPMWPQLPPPPPPSAETARRPPWRAPSEARCVALWDKYEMPEHIRAHSRKVALVATQVAELCDKVEKLSSSHEERLRMCIDHQSRLDLQEVQIADSIERLREMEC